MSAIDEQRPDPEEIDREAEEQDPEDPTIHGEADTADSTEDEDETAT